MKLEEAIRQKHFKSSRHKAFLNIVWAHNLISGKLEQVMKRAGLTSRQYNVLRILRGSYPEAMAMHEVKSRLLDRQSDLTRLTDRLIQKGWIERLECPTDRRRVHIRITEAGLKLLASLDYIEEEVGALLAPLSDAEVAELNRLLDKLCARQGG